MINLHPLKYAHVAVNFSQMTPWIFFKDSWGRVQENALWIEKNKRYPSNDLNDEEILANISLISKGNIQKPFITPQEYDEWHTSADLNLLTERSYGPPEVTIGSSRHVILKDVHLKGIGRNLLAISGSRFHSTGEFLFRDALQSLIIEKILTNRSSVKPLLTLGLLLPTDQDISKAPRVVQIRECDSFRLSQLHPAYLSRHDQKVAKFSLENYFKTNDAQDIFRQITSHLIDSFFKGIFHTSISPENLLLNGRWLDCESIELTLDGSPAPFMIELIFPIEILSKLNSLEIDFDSLIQLADHFFIRTSWIHDLKLAYTFYHQVLSSIFENKINDPISQLNSDLFRLNHDPTFWSYFMKLNSQKETYYLPLASDPVELGKNQIEQMKTMFSHYKIIGINSSLDQKQVYVKLTHAGIKVKDDFFKRYSKLEALFYPKAQNLSEAFLLGDTINKLGANI